MYAEGAFRVPVIYLNDWPDRYIHTNFDAPANIDPTKLQRAAFIGAASALFLANLRSSDVAALWSAMEAAVTRRAGIVIERRAALAPADEGAVLTRVFLDTERAAFASIAGVRAGAGQRVARGGAVLPAARRDARRARRRRRKRSGDALLVFTRVPGVNGPMSVFGYDYLDAHAKGPPPKLLDYRGLRGERQRVRVRGAESRGWQAHGGRDPRRRERGVRSGAARSRGRLPAGARGRGSDQGGAVSERDFADHFSSRAAGVRGVPADVPGRRSSPGSRRSLPRASSPGMRARGTARRRRCSPRTSRRWRRPIRARSSSRARGRTRASRIASGREGESGLARRRRWTSSPSRRRCTGSTARASIPRRSACSSRAA